MSLKNKVAIVTGGNSGIGLAIVLELARQEASTVVDYVVHPEATEELERQVSKLGGHGRAAFAWARQARRRAHQSVCGLARQEGSLPSASAC